MTYLDWASTTPPDPEIMQKALLTSSATFANPSSPHNAGIAAKMMLENARASFLASLSPATAGKRLGGNVAFTASGTEADQIPLLSLLRQYGREGRAGGPMAPGKPHLVVSAIEHAAIYVQAEWLSRIGFEMTLIKPDNDGIVRPSKVAEALRPSTKLVAIMAVNNETGSVQDITAIGRSIASATSTLDHRPPLFHVDCVQALGKIPLDLSGGLVTSAAFSAHKIQGPKGVGAFWYCRPIEALAVGGGQEGGIRSGTENIFGIEALAMCAAKVTGSMDARLAHAYSLEETLLSGIGAISGACILPLGRKLHDARWSPWIVSAAFPGLGGEVLARALSDADIAVSTGSACSHAHVTKRRRVLDAMGMSKELSFSAIRISFGPDTRMLDIQHFLAVVEDLYRRLKT